MHLFSDIGPICQYKLIFLDNTVGSTLLPSADFVDNVIISYYLNNASSSIVLCTYYVSTCYCYRGLPPSIAQARALISLVTLWAPNITSHDYLLVLIVMRETFSKNNNHLCAINVTDRLFVALCGEIEKNINKCGFA